MRNLYFYEDFLSIGKQINIEIFNKPKNKFTQKIIKFDKF